ncbi:MAG: peptidylprolyl isomerase [Candidatus Eisenbacteria bacterium]
MRSRVHAMVTFTCAAVLALATVARAEDTPAAAPAAAAAKTEAAKPASPAVDVAKATAADAAIKAIDAQIAKAAVNKKDAAWRTKLPLPTAVKFDANKSYFVRMGTTKGEVLIKFMPTVAPLHVTNFIYLTRLGYYDGLTFHRVITNFMAQGGDPVGNGTGGPGYGFNGEFSPAVRHSRPGMLSMANAGPGTDGSQFFLTFVATPWLDGKHTLFGEVVSGMDVLKALEAKGSQGGQTSERMAMTKVTVEVK